MARLFFGCQRLGAAVAAACILLVADPCAAARSPTVLSGMVAYRTPHEVRLLGRAQVGFTQMLGGMLTLGPTLYPGAPRGTITLGPVLSLDVYTWVPRLYAVAGLELTPVTPLVQVGAEVQRFVSMHMGLTGGIAAEWSRRTGLGALITLGIAWEP